MNAKNKSVFFYTDGYDLKYVRFFFLLKTVKKHEQM